MTKPETQSLSGEREGIVVLPPELMRDAVALLERALYLPSMEREDIDLTIRAISDFLASLPTEGGER